MLFILYSENKFIKCNKNVIGSVYNLIYIINKIIKMRRIKKDNERKIRLSITIDPEIHLTMCDLSNKSKYIEYALVEYFNKCGLDVSKIKL